jgi:hypothetical protein
MTRTMSSPFGRPGVGRPGGGTISFEEARGKSVPGYGDRDGRGRGVRGAAATWCGRTADSGEPGTGCGGGDTGDTRDGGDGSVTATRGGGLDLSRGGDVCPGDRICLGGGACRTPVGLGAGFGLGGLGFTFGRGGGPATVRTDVAEAVSRPQS